MPQTDQLQSCWEVMTKREEKDAKELTDEELFYSTYIQKFDDKWEALEKEVTAIEKFFLNKNTK